MTGKSPNPYPWLLATAAVAGVLFYLLGSILAPFLFAAILAYVCNPLVNRLEKHKVPRTLGVVLVLLLLAGLFVALVLILLPLFQKEVALFVEHLPMLVDWLKVDLAPWLERNFGIALQLDAAHLKNALTENLQSAQDIGAALLPSLKSGGLALMGFLANLLLVPVVFFYLLRDWNVMVVRIEEMIPRRWHVQACAIASDVDRVLAEFLRGQIAVMLVMSAYYAVGLALVGLEYALPIGLVAGLLVFVPYLGMVVGLSLATMAGLMQFQGLAAMVPVWIVFGIGQALEGTVVTPWLVGDRIGLHPVAVIFALLAFGQLFGFFGVLLALPASAALLVGLRHARARYLASVVYLD